MSVNKSKLYFLIRIFIILVIGIIYTYFTWYSSMNNTKDQAIKLVRIVETGLNNDDLKLLEVQINDIKKPQYKRIKYSLNQVKKIHTDIHYVYLYTIRDGRILTIADSETEDCDCCSTPGQEYTEADKIFYQAFDEKETFITHHIRDRWGSWISVLTQVKNPDTGEVIAILGMNYTPKRWYSYAIHKTMTAGLVAICIVLLIGFGNWILISNEALKKEKDKITTLYKELEESEKSKAIILSNLPGMAYRCKYDRDWTMLYVSEGCYELTGYNPENLLHNRDISFNEVIHPDFREYLWDKWNEVLKDNSTFSEEYQILTASGKIKWVLEHARGLKGEDGKILGLEGMIIDITKRIQKEEEIKYLNYHDTLTGLYNRRYFESQRSIYDCEEHYPLSVIMGDIDGLKLINDSLGHTEGDKLIIAIANILKANSRKSDILARTGGDEFSILMPDTTNDEADRIIKRICAACVEYKRRKSYDTYPLSISLGCATKINSSESITDIMKDAEDNMYRHKMLQSRSLHSYIINSMKSTLYEKSQQTEEHAQRLIQFSHMIGKKMKLSQKQLNELELLSSLHDIGKIGISDLILNKPDKLTEEEWIEMKKHPQIGYRIAMTTPELTPIAEYILCHHERWDGTGYPHGLKGEEIPLISRIIMLADAYDAMTSDRPYRMALTKDEAIREIELCSGYQFDPDIAELFIKLLKNIS